MSEELAPGARPECGDALLRTLRSKSSGLLHISLLPRSDSLCLPACQGLIGIPRVGAQTRSALASPLPARIFRILQSFFLPPPLSVLFFPQNPTHSHHFPTLF